jgi:hypothetical protein
MSGVARQITNSWATPAYIHLEIEALHRRARERPRQTARTGSAADDEQRTAYFDGDIVIATKKGVNPLERRSQAAPHSTLEEERFDPSVAPASVALIATCRRIVKSHNIKSYVEDG